MIFSITDLTSNRQMVGNITNKDSLRGGGDNIQFAHFDGTTAWG